MELTSAGEVLVTAYLVFAIVLWIAAIITAIHNDRLDGPPAW